MKLIAHRGNISGINLELENKQSYIDNAINNGYDVEIDVWKVDEKLYLGHDKSDYEIEVNWLLERSNYLWVHCKHFNSLNYLIDFPLKIFYHKKENHTIINNSNIIWSHDLLEAAEKSIIPLLNYEDIKFNYNKNVYGICSDWVSLI